MLDNYFKQAKIIGSTSEKSMSWIKSHDAIYFNLDRALDGFNELPFAIPIFGGTGDTYTEIHPWHHVFFEAEQDLDASVLLLFMGFYKDSFRSIRSFIELEIFALYNFVNGDNDYFQDWLKGEVQTPRLGDMLKVLNKESQAFHILNDKLGWNKEVESLYWELSGFMHTRGALNTHTSLRNSNQTIFSDIGVRRGVSLLLKAIRLAAMGFAVNFPMSYQALPLFDKFAFNQPAGGFLDEGQVERIKGIFTDDEVSVIAEICLSDSDAASLADGVKSMPDLSKKEILASLKKTIQSSEFEKSRAEILQMIRNDEIDKAVALVSAVQRAMMRAMTGVLFNPFYELRDSK